MIAGKEAVHNPSVAIELERARVEGVGPVVDELRARHVQGAVHHQGPGPVGPIVEPQTAVDTHRAVEEGGAAVGGARIGEEVGGPQGRIVDRVEAGRAVARLVVGEHGVGHNDRPISDHRAAVGRTGDRVGDEARAAEGQGSVGADSAPGIAGSAQALLDRERLQAKGCAPDRVEGAIEAIGIDDRRRGACADDRERVRDIEVAGRICVLARARNREGVRPRCKDDRVGPAAGRARVHRAVGVRRLNRLAQRAIPVDGQLIGISVYRDRCARRAGDSARACGRHKRRERLGRDAGGLGRTRAEAQLACQHGGDKAERTRKPRRPAGARMSRERHVYLLTERN